MKTKFRLICLILASVFVVSCGQHPVPPAQENEIIDAIYRSIDLTPEMFGENMVAQGLHEIPQYDFMADHYKTYANSYCTIYINFNNDTILSVEYDRSLNKNSDPAAYYKQFSDMIAGYDYMEWHGYYDDPDNDHNIGRILHMVNDFSYSQIAKDRDDLHGKINNEHLTDVNTTQYFAETFIYTHHDDSNWEGCSLMWSSIYFSGMHEGEGECYKDIQFNFILKRIQ